jgi:hypothetical protein
VEPGYRTPLLDFFRRGEVAPDIRMLAARGALAPRAHEQLGLLALLTDDPDPGIRAAAEQTLDRIPPAALAAFLARSDVGQDLRDFFAARGVAAGEAEAAVPGAAGAPLIWLGDEDSGLDEGFAASAEVDLDLSAEATAEEPVGEPSGLAGRGQADRPDETPSDDDPSVRKSTVVRIAGLKITQRIKLAMRGSREERAVLIRDPNKLVAIAVLSSPKVTDSEIEGYARMTSISEEVLRVIGSTRAWVKNYGVMSALARNPKTPLAISATLIKHLNERDVRNIAGDRNVPEALRVAARKIAMTHDQRRH